MGVRGFTTFVNAHPELLTECLLHSTQVIVDGNNFTYWLYFNSHIPCKFGANLDEFRNAAWKFVALLRRCEIEPIFVFDGCHQDDTKWRTSLERAKERIKIVNGHLKSLESRAKRSGATNKVECRQYLPILALEAVKQILITDCSAQCTTCDFEADAHIAQLAHELRVPVLSNDSDFFVFALSFGAVPFWSMNVHAVKLDAGSSAASSAQRNEGKSVPEDENTTTERFGLKVRMFTFANLRRFAKLEKDGHAELVPLIAALMGNDTVQRGAFSAFFASVRLGRAEREVLSASSASRRNTKQTKRANCRKPRPVSTRELSNFDSLFCWLTRFDSKRAAVDAILQRVKLEKRAKIERLIDMCYTTYTLIDSESNAANGSQDPKPIGNAKVAPQSVKSNDRWLPNEPAWFTEAIRRCEISSTLAAAARNSRVILQAQLEDFSATSSYTSCQTLRSRLYATLKSDACDEERCKIVVEFGRSATNMGKRTVVVGQPDVSFDQLGAVHSNCTDDDETKLNERSKLKMTLFCQICDCDEQFRQRFENLCATVPADLHFALFTTSYWCMRSLCDCNMNVRQCTLLALLLNFAKLNVASILRVQDQVGSDAPLTESFDESKRIQTVRDRIKARLAKYADEHEAAERLRCIRRRIELGVLQLLAEFQSCTLFVHMANQLCAYALARFRFSRLLNASLVFHFATDLARRPQPLKLTERLCQEVDDSGQLAAFVVNAYNHLSELLCTRSDANQLNLTFSESESVKDAASCALSSESESESVSESSVDVAASKDSTSEDVLSADDQSDEDDLDDFESLSIDVHTSAAHSENKFMILSRQRDA